MKLAFHIEIKKKAADRRRDLQISGREEWENSSDVTEPFRDARKMSSFWVSMASRN
jgi:hypothetical protein